MMQTISTYRDLKISKIRVFQVDLPLHEGSYKWSGGKSVNVFDATVVVIDTNHGIYGVGENTPLGSFYLPAYPEGTRAGIRVLAPHLINRNPTKLNELNDFMDRILKGHPYVKSAIDMACWDILGKVANLPVCELLGGRYCHDGISDDNGYPLYRAISQNSAEEMALNVSKYVVEQGYTKIQLKVGGDIDEDIRRIRAVREMLDKIAAERGLSSKYLLMCDANTGWLQHEAVRVVNAVSDLDNTYIEQPCLTYRECAVVRDKCRLPFVIDESMDDISMLCRVIADGTADCINLKIGKVGGITRAKAIRDLAVAHGIPMNVEDTWGGDIVTAAISHLAQSTRPDCLLCSTDFNSYGPVQLAVTTARNKGGRLAAPTTPGLGVEVHWDVLGQPVYECSEPVSA